jgi:hypothetical protein
MEKGMLRKLRTELIFTFVALAALLSIAAVLGRGLLFVPAVVLAFGLNVWAVTQSEREGFFRSRGMPRAGDPQRQFHPVQTTILFILMFLQVGVTSFVILTM